MTRRGASIERWTMAVGVTALFALGACSSSSSGGGGGNPGSSSSGGTASSSGGSSSGGGTGSSSGQNAANCGGNESMAGYGYASGTFSAPGFEAQLTCIGLGLRDDNETFPNGKSMLFTTGVITGTTDAGSVTVSFHGQAVFASAPAAQSYGPTDASWCGSFQVDFQASDAFNGDSGDASTCGGPDDGALTITFTDPTNLHGSITGTMTDVDHPKLSGTFNLTF